MPHTFKDNRGEEWIVALPYGTVVRVRKESQGRFDLLEPFATDLQDRLRMDTVEFWELLQLLTEPQANARGISAAEFGERMASACVFDAQRAFFAEWVDFFRGSQRPDVAEGLAQIWTVHEKALAVLLDKVKESKQLQTAATRTAEKIGQEMTRAFDTLAQRCESIPSPTPGENSTS